MTDHDQTISFFELLRAERDDDLSEPLKLDLRHSRFRPGTQPRLPAALQRRPLSASAIKEYMACPRKFYYHRVAKKPETHPSTSHYSWLGLAVHNTMYYAVADMVKDGDEYRWVVRDGMRPFDDVKAFFYDVWYARVNAASHDSLRFIYEAGDMPRERPNFILNARLSKLVRFRNATPEDIEAHWLSEAWRMVETGYSYLVTHAAPLLGSLKIEHELKFERDGLAFIGYIDMLFTPPDREAFFLDFKTGMSEPDNLLKDPQFLLYRTALRDLGGLKYEPTGLYVHLTSAQVFPADGPVAAWQTDTIDKAISGIQQRDWRPNILNWQCAGCEYRGYCFTREMEPKHE
jgi:hypothetical protein